VPALNRPAARNALSRSMLDGLARLLAQAEADPAIGAIVVTGAGAAFCAGSDKDDCPGPEAIHHVQCGHTDDHKDAVKAVV
jgi:enoyl-CoA hydratase/carnithine racemase